MDDINLHVFFFAYLNVFQVILCGAFLFSQQRYLLIFCLLVFLQKINNNSNNFFGVKRNYPSEIYFGAQKPIFPPILFNQNRF